MRIKQRQHLEIWCTTFNLFFFTDQKQQPTRNAKQAAFLLIVPMENKSNLLRKWSEAPGKKVQISWWFSASFLSAGCREVCFSRSMPKAVKSKGFLYCMRRTWLKPCLTSCCESKKKQPVLLESWVTLGIPLP